MARRPGPSLRALLFGWGRCLQVRSMLQIRAVEAGKQVVEAVALQAYIPGATSRCGTQTFKNVLLLTLSIQKLQKHGTRQPWFCNQARLGSTQGSAAGGGAPYLRADAPHRLRRISRPSILSQCGLESFWMETCFRNPPAPKVLGRDLPDGTRKSYRFTWGGGIFRPKPPVFDRSWRSPSKNTIKTVRKTPVRERARPKSASEKWEKKPCFSTFWPQFFGLQHLFLRFRRWPGPEADFWVFGPIFGLIFVVLWYLEHPKKNNYSTKWLLLIFCFFWLFILPERFLSTSNGF